MPHSATPPPNPAPPLPPPGIPAFFRIGPLLLIIGSLHLVAAALILASALRWSNPLEGLPVAATMTLLFGIPLFILLTIVQSILALIFMRKRQPAWWRTTIVLLPSALVVGACLVSIVLLFPPERRARRELADHLGGAVPASTRNVQLHYNGGIDPDWTFEFDLDLADYEVLKSYRSYTSGSLPPPIPGPPSSSTTLQADAPGYFYYLDYDPSRRRCRFQVMNY